MVAVPASLAVTWMFVGAPGGSEMLTGIVAESRVSPGSPRARTRTCRLPAEPVIAQVVPDWLWQPRNTEPSTTTSYVLFTLRRQLTGAVQPIVVWPFTTAVTCTLVGWSGGGFRVICAEFESVDSPGSPSARTTTVLIAAVPVIVHVVAAMLWQRLNTEPPTSTSYVWLALPLKLGAVQVIVPEPLALAVSWMF